MNRIVSRFGMAALVGALSLSLAAPAIAQAPTTKLGAGPKEFEGIKPEKVEKGNAKLPEVKKKRAGGTHAVATPDLLKQWFTELNLSFRADDQGRLILPFRDEASGLNLNLVIVPRMKADKMWAIQAVIPIQVPMSAGDAGIVRALVFSNEWNNNTILIKSSLIQPAGQGAFFLLEATLPCEDGLSRGEFFQNFLSLLVQNAQVFAQKAAAAVAG